MYMYMYIYVLSTIAHTVGAQGNLVVLAEQGY